jgi:hypothetical protein
MTARVCIEQGCPLMTEGTRCPEHERAFQRAREEKPNRAVYRGSSRRMSRAARAAEPWCHRPGPDGTPCGRTPDLTYDHETGTVECRSCNSSHRGTTVPSKKGYATALDPEAYDRETR